MPQNTRKAIGRGEPRVIDHLRTRLTAPLLIEALKELRRQNVALRERLDALEHR